MKHQKQKHHHPYHFIPVSKKDGPGGVPLAAWPPKDPTHLTHDRWVETDPSSPAANFSGRLIRKLVTETPLVVGNEQERQGNSPLVKQYSYGNRPAIPASSLRGLLSSAAEAASSSALRILSDESVPLFATANPNLPPLGSHKSRTTLTLAELLFGFVAETKDHPGQNHAFASRVLFSAALTETGKDKVWLGSGPVILAAMKGPSLKSHKLYESPSRGPRGRKVYLHHLAQDQGKKMPQGSVCWDPRKPENHLQAEPLKAGLEFYFHIDFQNLSRLELGLLCYALCPNDLFRHKLGLGKPLGLGTVRIAPCGLFLIDRTRRYLDDALDAPRYHAASLGTNIDPAAFPPRYEDCKTALRLTPPIGKAPGLADLAAGFRAEMAFIDPAIPNALEQLGDPANVRRDARIEYLLPSQEPRETILPPLSGDPRGELPVW